MNKFVQLLMACTFAVALTSATAQTEPVEKTAGRVVKVDPERGKVTLAHARIKSIDMAAMTMPFKVRDASMLTTLKPGDQVLFSVAVLQDELVITRLDLTQARRAQP